MTAFVIPGKPYGKKRAKASTFAGRARMYNPAENISYEQTVASIALPHFPQPIVGAVRLAIVATFAPPQSWSRRKAEAAIGKPHIQKPDADNIGKAVMDGLNRIAWADDVQVADLRTVKLWGDVEQVSVTVEAFDAV